MMPPQPSSLPPALLLTVNLLVIVSFTHQTRLWIVYCVISSGEGAGVNIRCDGRKMMSNEWLGSGVIHLLMKNNLIYPMKTVIHN